MMYDTLCILDMLFIVYVGVHKVNTIFISLGNVCGQQ